MLFLREHLQWLAKRKFPYASCLILLQGLLYFLEAGELLVSFTPTDQLRLCCGYSCFASTAKCQTAGVAETVLGPLQQSDQVKEGWLHSYMQAKCYCCLPSAAYVYFRHKKKNALAFLLSLIHTAPYMGTEHHSSKT